MALQRGKQAFTADPEITGIRSLARADLSALLEKRPPQMLKNLSDGHHAVARAVAAGLNNIEVAQLTGRTATRVSMLKQDPAFAELVAHYRGLVTAEYVRSVDSFMEVATANMLKAAVMISDKLDDAIDKGEFLPTRDLLAIHDTGADRFGYGKMQKNLNVNVDFASQLEKARARSGRAKEVGSSAQPAPVIDHAPHPPALSPGPTFRRL